MTLTRIERILTLDKAKEAWLSLIQPKTIYDDWNFRYCFYKYFNYPLFFYVAYDGNRTVALLPLQHNTDLGYLEFFGGSYMEDNRALALPGYEDCIPELYKHITEPARLEYIIEPDAGLLSLPFQDNKYILSLDGINTHEDYFARYLDAESRGKMRRKIRKVEKENVEMVHNNFSDLDMMIRFNIDNFGADSSFNDRPHHRKIFHDLLGLGFPVHLLTFKIAGKVEGVSLALLYNRVYEYFNLGVNKAIPGMSTYISIKNLEAAINAGAKIFDAFTGDYGWKEHWHLEKTPQYKYILPAAKSI